MDKIAIIYWSQTGNTEAMAQALYDGVKEAGGEADLFQVSDISADQAASYSKLMLGCPAMGAEVLEEEEFEPFFSDLEGKLADKKVALFGSYGWGDGEWMRLWQDRVNAAKAQLFGGEGLIVHETPDDDAIAQCKNFAKDFCSF